MAKEKRAPKCLADLDLEAVQVAIQFISLYDQLDRQGPGCSDDIRLSRIGGHRNRQQAKEEAFQRNKNIVAQQLGKPKYDNLPVDAKSFISRCGAIAKRNKNLKPSVYVHFIDIGNELYQKLIAEKQKAAERMAVVAEGDTFIRDLNEALKLSSVDISAGSNLSKEEMRNLSQAQFKEYAISILGFNEYESVWNDADGSRAAIIRAILEYREARLSSEAVSSEASPVI